jgi:transglutaminase-like putative cysteine protease
LVLFLLVAFVCSACAQAEKTYYAVEKAGNLVGFIEIAERPGETEGHRRGPTDTHILMRLTLLGQPVDLTMHETRRFDPQTGRVSFIEGEIHTPQGSISATAEIEGDRILFTPLGSRDPVTIPLEADLYLDEGRLISALAERFAVGDDWPITLKSFDPARGRILERRFSPVGLETIVLDGVAYECVVLDVDHLTTGASERQWIDPQAELMIRTELSDGTVIYLADSTVPSRIRRASIDSMIFATVDARIDDVQRISYMKVRATIRSYGEVVTADSLNVPGQRFEGTVDDNLIDGIFEVGYPRYDGRNAPPFPPDFSDLEDLQPYLGAGFMIEADDPVLAEKARELTEGAEDSWDAVRRLADWVGHEIEGAIVLGSARQTYDAGKGECGGHTRLFTAFARSVGIPARMVSGGVYTDIKGGSFGQHVWSEVWMGEEVGWVPLDTTFRESTYVDSGHIRLGGMTGFQPLTIEVLDYRVGSPR